MRVSGFVVVVMLSATLASASPAAEKLFQDGKQLLKEGKLGEACDAFRKSQELEPRIGTLLNLGDCEERRGRIATAWEAFVAARAMAKQKTDEFSISKGVEADKRVAAVAPKLPYLTIRAAQPGVAITRDGKPVAAAELDHEVPIDPGRYELEANAAGHLAWKQTAVVAIGQKVVIHIPALARDPSAVAAPTEVATARPATPAVVASAPATKLPAKHRIGFGAAVGVSTDSDLIYGIRIPIQLAPVGNGAIRALPTLFYASFDDPEDQYHHIDLYAVGLGVEYVAPIAPTFFIAAGAGVGMDFIDDNYGDQVTNQTWGALRLSPTLRVGKAVDIGLHIQAVATKDRVVGLGELGVDYFFY